MSPELEQSTGVACPKCGQSNPDGWLVCGNCHAALHASGAAANPDSNVAQENPDSSSLPRRRTHRLALASLAFGVVGIFAPAGILAIILGHAARFQINRDGKKYRGRDVAKLGLILGYAGVLIFGTLLYLFKNPALFVRPAESSNLAKNSSNKADENSDPYYRAVRNRPTMSIADRENKGVTLLRAIQDSQTNYRKAHPASGYTCILEDLFESGFDASLVQLSIDTGYTLSITGCSPDTKGVNLTYRAIATPPTGAGNLLCTDDKGVIRSSNSPSDEACFTSGKPLAIQ